MTTCSIPALLLAGCTLYLGDDAPQVPSPGPPPPPPPDAAVPPPPDAAWVDSSPNGPGLTRPPLGSELRIPLSEGLRAQAAYLEVAGIAAEPFAYHEIIPIPADATEMTLSTADAELLSVSLHTASGQLIDAAAVGGRCPGTAMARPSRVFEVPFHHPTIQDAIDAAGPGDIVYVHPGIYAEHLLLTPGIRLIGAGATRTILEGLGDGQNLIDFSGARDVVIRGFTLRNVGLRTGCGDPRDPFACIGGFYAAAIYGDGHERDQFGIGCPGASAVIAHNIFESNEIGVMLYFYAPAVIRNNLFIGNTRALAVNHLNDNTLVVNNTFVNSEASAIADQNGYLDLFNNIITGATVGLVHELEQYYRNDLACNAFFDNGYVGDYVYIDDVRNFSMDPELRDPAAGDYRLGTSSPLLGRDCFAVPEQNIITAPGAYGGFAGGWYQQPIDLQDLAPLVGLL